MVRLVLVSHSRPLADALVDFVRQMAGADVPIDVAAGVGNGESFGTDATAIEDAIRSGSVDDGVVLIADVGSAVMSAEMALDLLEPSVRNHVVLADAPLVEGALSAAVQAGLGADLETVVREAETAGGPKRPDSARNGPSEEPTAASPDSGPRAAFTAVLPNEHGLHARPAARLVRVASEFDASITLENRTAGHGPVPAASIASIARLGAVQGHEVRVVATGPDAEDAAARLRQLIEDGFGEEPSEEPASRTASEERRSQAPPAPTDEETRGRPIAPGIAVGPAFLYARSVPDLPDEPSEDPEAAWRALADAVERIQSELDAQQSAAARRGATQAAGIYDALSLLLEDETVRDAAREKVQNDVPVARAWRDAMEEVARDYASLDDPYHSARADDVRDVARQVVRELMGVEGGISAPEDPFVLVADHLAPSEVTALPDHTLGVLCTEGNHTSHSAILLRSRGIPTVFQAPEDTQGVEPGRRIALDGSTGEVWLDVSDDVAADLAEQRKRRAEQEHRQRSEAQEPASTRDGTSVRIEANVNQPEDASLAAQNGADGIGLLRTEFLFPARQDPPSENQQVQRLQAVLEAVPDRPVTVRVLDVGGDKPLPYISLPDERNPFLGIRGIRLLLRERDLFHTQLRSLLRVAADHPVRIMLPMVVSADEVRRSREAVDRARASLEDDGLPAPASIEVGAMIETPASALGADRLAEVADFFSIGTNDLTQYTVAVDREHAELSGLTDVLTPPVLSLIERVVRSGREHNIPVSCCGEAAADPDVIPVFLGLGLRSLSVSPPSIPEVKSLVRSLDLDTCRRLADEALRSDNPVATRRRSRQLRSDSNGAGAG